MNDILYNGIFPEIGKWIDISLEEYNIFARKFKGRTWDFREQSIKYCKLDCKVLIRY